MGLWAFLALALSTPGVRFGDDLMPPPTADLMFGMMRLYVASLVGLPANHLIKLSQTR